MSAYPWKIYGAFELDKNSPKAWQALFRNAVLSPTGLADAAGVYVIAVTNRERNRIRYIGMTYKLGFAAEIFSQRNLECVWDIIRLERSKTIRVWLFAKPYPKRPGFSVDRRLYRQAHLLEQLLIMHARAAGHTLINTKKMQSAEGIAAQGLFGTRMRGPRPSAAEIIGTALKMW